MKRTLRRYSKHCIVSMLVFAKVYIATLVFKFMEVAMHSGALGDWGLAICAVLALAVPALGLVKTMEA